MSANARLLKSVPRIPLAIACTTMILGFAHESRAQSNLKEVVRQSFVNVHDGWSSDEVLLNDSLNTQFIQRCRQQLQDVPIEELNWTLLNLRKAGQLGARATKRKNVDTQSVTHIAEIVTRSLQDQHRVSTDRIMCQPALRAEFDRLAKSMAPSVDAYLVRRAAFRLRKTRQLKPELITRIVNWGRQIETFSAEAIQKAPDQVPTHPGIYIFRDETGYLYIGQSRNLRSRLQEHLDESHSHSLQAYLKNEGITNITIEIHAFDPDSQAAELMARRAYESALIASRRPRFNVQP